MDAPEPDRDNPAAARRHGPGDEGRTFIDTEAEAVDHMMAHSGQS